MEDKDFEQRMDKEVEKFFEERDRAEKEKETRRREEEVRRESKRREEEERKERARAAAQLADATAMEEDDEVVEVRTATHGTSMEGVEGGELDASIHAPKIPPGGTQADYSQEMTPPIPATEGEKTKKKSRKERGKGKGIAPQHPPGATPAQSPPGPTSILKRPETAAREEAEKEARRMKPEERQKAEADRRREAAIQREIEVYGRAREQSLSIPPTAEEMANGEEGRDVAHDKATVAAEAAVLKWIAAGRPTITGELRFADPKKMARLVRPTTTATGAKSSAQTETQTTKPAKALGAVTAPKPTWEPTWAQRAAAPAAATRGRTNDGGFSQVGRNGKAAKQKPAADQLAPKKDIRFDQKRVIFVRDGETPLPPNLGQEVASAVNIALHRAGAPAHIRIERMTRNAKGTNSANVTRGADADMLLLFKAVALEAARKADAGIVDIRSSETYQRIKIARIPLNRYLDNLDLLRCELEAENAGLLIPTPIRWLRSPSRMEGATGGSVVISVSDRKVAERLTKEGIRAAGRRMIADKFLPLAADSQCGLCMEWGHIELHCGAAARCGFCAGPHHTAAHRCRVTDCQTPAGSRCRHLEEKCANCDGNHLAASGRCEAKKAAIGRARGGPFRG